MKLRWKLLIILLSLTAVPMMAISFMTKQSSHELLEDMTSSSRKILIARAKSELLRRMEDHAAIVSKERQIVGLALKAQSGRLRSILEGTEKRIGIIKPKSLEESNKHFRIDSAGNMSPLQIDKQRVRIDFDENATVKRSEAKKSLKPMIRVFRKLERINPDLVYWQIVRLTNGTIATFPYYEIAESESNHASWMNSHKKNSNTNGQSQQHSQDKYISPNLRDFAPQDWPAVIENTQKAVVWTPPFRDPVTEKLVVGAITRIQTFKGTFHGAMMIMVPLGEVLKGDLDVHGFSKSSSSLLVKAKPRENGESGLKVIAEEHKGEDMTQFQSGWKTGPAANWLTHKNTKELSRMTTDLENGRSGTSVMDYRGKSSLWVYAPVNNAAISLVLIVPMENIIHSTTKTEQILTSKIENQYTTISTIIWSLMLASILASLLLSKTMTRRISKLATAFNSLAQGDFSTRIDVTGKDELSDLSHSFNNLAPSLEEQVRLKEALTVAQEVQRSLLPETPPQINGLDVAGMSMYCEDTGGDYFDYPHLGIEADELGLAVGDVSGHGIPAALLMTTARAFLRQRAQRGGDLSAVVGDANKMLADDVRLSGRFMTLFLFAIDPDTRTARWVRAGHDPALVYTPSADIFSELGGDTGLPLGVDGDWSYIEEHATLKAGSIILIGTDGIWEATNTDGEMYGKERLNDILQTHHSLKSQEILNIILQSLKDFTEEAGFEDDVTLAVVKIQ